MSKYKREEIESKLFDLGLYYGKVRKEDLPIKELGIPSYNTCMRLGIVLSDMNRKIAEYLFEKEDKRCKECGSNIQFENRENLFCGRSCAVSHSNKRRGPRPSECNEKISRSLQGRRSAKIVVPIRCTICESYHVMSGKTCSSYCKNVLVSQSIRKAHEEGRHLGNKYRSRINPSYMERTFKEWIDENFPEVEYETEKSVSIYVEGEYYKTFYLDFYFPHLNVCIELDGSQHKDMIEYDNARDDLIKEYYDIDVVRISHEEYQQKTKVRMVCDLLS